MTGNVTADGWVPKATRFMLLGTVHGDPRGFGRLRAFLELYQPDLILIELSPFGWAFRRAHQKELNRTLSENLRHAKSEAGYSWRKALAHPEIQAIRRQIALPFEFRASFQYARTHDKRLLLVDRSEFSQALVARWPDLLSMANLVFLLTIPSVRQERAVEDQYRRAHALLSSPSLRIDRTRSAIGGPDRAAWEERERYLAERIRDAILAIAPRSCVYVGGWEHLTNQDEPPSLRCLLHIPATRCCLLDDYDLQTARVARNVTKQPSLRIPDAG